MKEEPERRTRLNIIGSLSGRNDPGRRCKLICSELQELFKEEQMKKIIVIALAMAVTLWMGTAFGAIQNTAHDIVDYTAEG